MKCPVHRKGNLTHFDSSQEVSLVLRSKLHEKMVTAVPTGHLKKESLHISLQKAV